MAEQQDYAQQRREVAQACRVLAMQGLVSDILGHVSLRVGDELLLLRARGPADDGLLLTTAADIVLIDLDGKPAEDIADHTLPQEMAIHLAVMRNREDAGAVVHAHPPDVVACSIAGLALEPIYGAFNIPAMRLAERGIPVYDYYGLVKDRRHGDEMAGILGASQAVVLRGHGLTATGPSLAAAVVTAVNVNQLAGMTLKLASTGMTAPPLVPTADRAELPDLGTRFNHDAVWRTYIARLAQAGLTLTSPSAP
jgi:ribulose-5-phosphate 4-epimerase/fuculose-1-phosphate aldolase